MPVFKLNKFDNSIHLVLKFFIQLKLKVLSAQDPKPFSLILQDDDDSCASASHWRLHSFGCILRISNVWARGRICELEEIFDT